MRSLLLLCLGLAAVSGERARAQEFERNLWPLKVEQWGDRNEVISWTAAGPLLFSRPSADGGTVSGLRPLYVQRRTAENVFAEASVLYPLFIYRADSDTYRWSIFNLINRSGPQPATQDEERFDIWPFWFSRQTGSPETSYRALFPIYGTLKRRLAFDRVSWVLFPAYARFEKNDVVRRTYLWPIVRHTAGGEQGFAVWPLFGYRTRPGVFHDRYYLWPLIYKNATGLDQPEPMERVGVLPFYTRDRGPGIVNENYLWPFFGFTDRTEPYRYHETRYFWPFLVQGRGDRYRNRWAPFYTHSITKGVDKKWFMWPVVRQDRWTEDAIAQQKTQVLYFLYWSQVQRSLLNPELPPASKRHLWPLVSTWNNGAGRRQVQVLSPLEIFFPHNETVRQTWSPLFAVYRFNRQSPDSARHAFLFQAVTWRREDDRREFNLGPLLQVRRDNAAGRIALGRGLLGLKKRETGRGWRPFFFEFSSAPAQRSLSASADLRP